MNAYKTKTLVLAGNQWMETKIDAEGRRVMGYFAAFGNKDSDGDIIMPGAFAKSIAERGPQSNKNRILFLRDHDSSKVLGRLDVLREDDKGLYFEAVMAKTPLGDEALELYKMGALTEHSIGYQIIKSRYDQANTANILEEIKLWEGSVVPWGANEMTPLVGIKGIAPDYLNRLEQLAKQAPDDEWRQKVAILAEQLKAELNALDQKEQPTDEVTEPKEEPQAGVPDADVIKSLKLLKTLL